MSTVKLILGLIVFALLAMVGFKVVPVYFANYQFEDAIKNEALRATYSSLTEDDIRESIIKQARSYDIPLTPKQVHVTRVGSNITGSLSIDVEYSVPIDIFGFSTTLEFHPTTKNKSLL
jgi:hypothetical protein